MRTYGLLLFSCLLSCQVLAAEYKPYPFAEITPQQWQDYYDIVQSEFGETKQEETDAMLVLFSDESTHIFFSFTMPDHPAHPAWITRQVVEVDGEISMEQIGYFAGHEGPFAALFQDFAELSDQLRSDFKSQEDPQE
jgi:hypothetical protein